MKTQKNLLRLSDIILMAVSSLRKQRLVQIQSDFTQFCGKYSNAFKDLRMLNLAVECNWTASAEKIRSRISRNTNDFSYQLQRFRELINTDPPKTCRLSDIFAELNQIEQDISELKYDLKEKTVSVVTESVILDEISFGPFEIKLYIDEIRNLYKDSPYKVIALNPNPAGSDYNVTHPHVSCEKLCEGDGYTAIRRALEDGRLCDFFRIIISILQTYNPESPYVSIDDWEGICCYDCGCTVSGDDSYYCEYCDRDYCSNCSTYCQRCETTICLGCAYECPGCNEPVCKNCTEACKECEEIYCKDCLNEEGLCQQCVENRKENKNEEQESNSETVAAIQPDSMGKTIIHT